MGPRLSHGSSGHRQASPRNTRRIETNITIYNVLGASPLTGMDYHGQLGVGGGRDAMCIGVGGGRAQAVLTDKV